MLGSQLVFRIIARCVALTVRRFAVALSLLVLLLVVLSGAPASAEDASAPAFLEMFEAKWNTIENRMADIFATGYGRMWLPPPQRADSGNQSVGYDVFDRFDLGKPRNETLYGTETGLKTLVRAAHSAGVLVNTDFVPNHNGFSNSGTVDTKGTATTSDDVTFAQNGGYPGFVLSTVGDVDGDFHGAFESGQENFRLSGLIDIAQEKNHQFIRQPRCGGQSAKHSRGDDERLWPRADECAGRQQRAVLPGPGTRRYGCVRSTAEPERDAVRLQLGQSARRAMRWRRTPRGF